VPSLLLDLSAWARSGHASVAGRWSELVEGDHVACHPVFAVELLHNAINAEEYQELRNDLDGGFDWVWPDAETTRMAMRLQQRMATAATCGQRVKTPDLLIAALAVQHRLGVLHYDVDYDLIHAHGGEPFESAWLAPKGSLESASAKGRQARTAYRKAFGERMVQFQHDTDLEIWPAVLAWMDERLEAHGLPVPSPPAAD
jgi:predicted nucleic acid-binding protein